MRGPVPTRGAAAFAVALAAVLTVVFAAGCADVGEIGGAVVRLQSCDDSMAVATQTAEDIDEADPAEMRRILDEAATVLDDAAGTAGDATLREAIEGLAHSYRDVEIRDPAEARHKVATTTAKYLQVITASCASA